MTPAAAIYAHAVIGSARKFGVCPLVACRTDVTQLRRPLAPAAFAVADITGRSRTTTCATLGIVRDSATAAERRAPEIFNAAQKAAVRALAKAMLEEVG